MFRGFLVFVCSLAVLAPVAAAQDPDVIVDPGSPSGKEYALPIDRARQQASRGKKSGSGAKKAPLFGEGVNGSDDSASNSKKSSKKTSRASTKRAQAEAERVEAEETVAREAAEAKLAAARTAALAEERGLPAQARTPDGGIGIGGFLAAGVGVLLVGGLIGLWLRRRAST